VGLPPTFVGAETKPAGVAALPTSGVTATSTNPIPANRLQLQKQIMQNQQAYRSAEQRDREQRQRELLMNVQKQNQQNHRPQQRAMPESIRSQLSSEVDIVSCLTRKVNDLFTVYLWNVFFFSFKEFHQAGAK
jgi:hypothetical protein